MQITEEQRVKAELQQQVDNLRARIADQRLQMGGLNNSNDQEAKVRRSRRRGRARGLALRCADRSRLGG